eukprot:CAMPEP_0196130048 /NCGR_PEP_ID=MMETSP0910-20130528/552_1 /TAXON_ID=49265 /ORGANISM="Thalassiosira rotula, Strain GSO102" /LENGTH=182 /DNA_ID=CAMNT_0041389273 /DNA_START=167 /DNA_END=715 /DNA_ORIENTATION=-
MALSFQSGLRGTLRFLGDGDRSSEPTSTDDLPEGQYAGAGAEPVASPGPVDWSGSPLNSTSVQSSTETSSGGMSFAGVILLLIITGAIIGCIACCICACNQAKTNALPRTLVEGDTDVHRAESHPKQNGQDVGISPLPAIHKLDIPVAVAVAEPPIAKAAPVAEGVCETLPSPSAPSAPPEG